MPVVVLGDGGCRCEIQCSVGFGEGGLMCVEAWRTIVDKRTAAAIRPSRCCGRNHASSTPGRRGRCARCAEDTGHKLHAVGRRGGS